MWAVLLVLVEGASQGGAAQNGLDELVLAQRLGEVVLSWSSAMDLLIAMKSYLHPSGQPDTSRDRQP